MEVDQSKLFVELGQLHADVKELLQRMPRETIDEDFRSQFREGAIETQQFTYLGTGNWLRAQIEIRVEKEGLWVRMTDVYGTPIWQRKLFWMQAS